MKEKSKILDLNSYLENGAIIIYYTFATISCLGYLLDILNFRKTSEIMLYDNLVTIVITIISYVLYLIKKLNLKASFGILLYAALANVLIDTFSDPFAQDRIFFFLRDSFFILILITLSSLLIKKIHAILIAFIYAITVIILAKITQSAFLQESLFIIILFVSVYALVIYYFVNILEHSIQELETDKQIILDKNETVNETNTFLEERQQLIEEQSEVLTAQTAALKMQSEQLKLKNSELELLNKTKDKFFSILAHDLKNPLHVIMGFADLLEQRFHELDDVKKLKFIKVLNTTSKKTSELLTDLLKWGKSQTNMLSFEPKNAILGNLIEKNIDLLIENCLAKKITVIKEIQPDCMVFVDIDMIETVVRNLFSNAIKFTPKGGEIHISCAKQGNVTEVQFTDNGIGMDDETLKNLFKLDKSNSRTGTAGETGTGLGLLLCQDFVEKNGGRIWATGKADKGSIFTFTVPVAV